MMTKGKLWGALLATSVAFAASASAETIKIGTEGAYLRSITTPLMVSWLGLILKLVRRCAAK